MDETETGLKPETKTTRRVIGHGPPRQGISPSVLEMASLWLEIGNFFDFLYLSRSPIKRNLGARFPRTSPIPAAATHWKVLLVAHDRGADRLAVRRERAVDAAGHRPPVGLPSVPPGASARVSLLRRSQFKVRSRSRLRAVLPLLCVSDA
jgi:hypothetical protein